MELRSPLLPGSPQSSLVQTSECTSRVSCLPGGLHPSPRSRPMQQAATGWRTGGSLDVPWSFASGASSAFGPGRPAKFLASFIPSSLSAYGCVSGVTRAQASSSAFAASSTAPGRSSTGGQSTASPPSAPAQAAAEEQVRRLVEWGQEAAAVAVRAGPLGPLRFLQGLQALSTVGSEWLLDQLQKQQQVSSRTSAGAGAGVGSPVVLPSVSPPGPRELRRLFEQLGATYIKLGQFIASTPTIFPADYVEEMQRCLDKSPAVPFERIQAIIRADLGRPPQDVFLSLDPVPLASASIAQVHSGVLRSTGEEVVVKVVKPGVKDTLTTDLSFLYLSAKLLEILNPQLSRTSLVGILSDIRASMLEETDMRKEAANMDAFRTYLTAAGLTGMATAPRVYPSASGEQVLTMQRLRGVALTDLQAIRTISPNPEATLIAALNVWFGSLLACESFHADVHAGNLLVLQDGRIGFIDFGIVGRIAPSTWAAVSAFLASVGQEDYDTMARALVQMGAAETSVDIPAFAMDLEKVFTAVQELDPEVLITATQGPGGAGSTVSASVAVDEQQINSLMINVVTVGQNYGLRFPREFGLLLKQLLYFDRYTRLLAPSLNMLDDRRVRFQAPRTSYSL